MILYLMVAVGTFLFVWLCYISWVLSKNREANLQYMAITGKEEEVIKPSKDILKKTEVLVRLENLARGAGWQLNGVEVLLIMLVFGGACFGALMTLFNNSTVACVAIPGIYVPVFFMKERAKKRGLGMILQLAGYLTRLANLIRSGSSLAQAINIGSEGVAEPLGPVVLRIREKIQRNVSAVTALEEAIPDIPLNDFKTVCLVANIHKQLGGDLAASFDDVATTLKDSHAAQENLTTQTSAIRYSSLIVGIVPFVVIVSFQIISGGTYYNKFLQEIYGQIAAIVSMLSIFFGWWRIYKMAEIKLS